MNLTKRLGLNPQQGILFTLLVGLLWAREPILLFANIVLARFGFIGRAIVPLFITVLLIASFTRIKTHITSSGIIVYTFVVLCFFLNYLIFPENENALNEYQSNFLLASSYIFVGQFVDFHLHRNFLYNISVVSILVIFIQMYLSSDKLFIDGGNEMMVTSYRTLPHALMVLYFTYKENSIFRIILSIATLFFLISFGTRGPLICLIFYSAAYLFILCPFKSKGRARLIIVVCLSVFYFFSDKLLSFLYSSIESIGMSTRILDYVSEDQILDDSGRATIKDGLMDILYKNDGLGFGLGGDVTLRGGYAHSIYHELLFSFGYIGGGVIFCAIIYTIIRALRCSRDTIHQDFVLILISCGFINLFMSGTFITSTFFYFLIGYCLRVIYKSSYKGLYH